MFFPPVSYRLHNVLIWDHISQRSLYVFLFAECADLEEIYFNPGEFVGLRIIHGHHKVHR